MKTIKDIVTPQGEGKRGKKKHIRISSSLKTHPSTFTNILAVYWLHNLYVACKVFVVVVVDLIFNVL